jgi:cobalt-zinc-cadmium efflux system protein
MAHDHAHHHHDHAHGHGHDHGHAGGATERRIFWAMVLIAAFTVVELAGGLLAGSLALVAEGGHMLADAAALALAFVSIRVARRPADPARSYGDHRLEVLAAFVNGLALLALVAWIVVEAARRLLLAPVAIAGDAMLALALLGLVVNLAGVAILAGGDRASLNLHGALLHVLSDVVGSLAAIVAALVIRWTGWLTVDPLLSLVGALLLVRSSWRLVRRSAHVLLEGTPEGLDLPGLRAGLAAAAPGLKDIHHVHAWSLTAGKPLLTLHGTIQDGAESETVLRQVKRHLEHLGFSHSVVQLERDCPDDEHHA